jgi:hypothetical protein
MNWAADGLAAQQGLRKAFELIEAKKYREAQNLLYDVQDAEYRLRAMVAKLTEEQEAKGQA